MGCLVIHRATFKNNDVVTRKNLKPYTHVWRVCAPGGTVLGLGFAASEGVAYARAAACERRCIRNGVAVLYTGYEVVQVTTL